MKRLLFYLITIIVLCHVGMTTASAQRTATGKPFIGISQFVSGYSIPSGGLGIEGGQYLLNSYWKVGVRAIDWNQKIVGMRTEDDKPVYFDHILWNLSGSWMYRAFGTYGRTFNFYVGAGAFIGLNQYEVFHKFPAEVDSGLPHLEFVYGVEPAIDIEIFPFRRVALVIGIQSPITLSSSLKTDLWHLSGSLGVRFNL